MAVDAARAKSLFLNASELADLSERAAYLERECGRDAALRERVEALLAADDGGGRSVEGDATETSHLTSPETQEATAAVDTGTRLASGSCNNCERQTGRRLTSPSPAAPRTDRPGRSGVGQVIAGRYTLREVLGEGGMGTVYRTDQTAPVKRQVALKLIKVGMDSRAVLARFDAERQALALMDHPNIARVYDGGTTPTGQPFFVMELVSGVPITDYCDQKRLSVRARLELFVAVCQAVQHAHQKGIIHRDIKPSNVMVTEVGGRPTPKVIDFGVAKATGFDLTDLSFADTGAIVGTPTYMSPEQADPSSMDIDTRTDVYALGVILYELLAGSPPLDPSQFKRGALLEMLRMVREADPPKPSTRVSTSDALPNIAASRGIDPAQLKRALAGDLDWIVMKALEKDRARRYQTANGFAADVQRHLAYEPVLAAPPSRAYRLRKFVRKNRGAVIAASLVVFALLAGMVGTSLALIEADARRREAETNLAFATKGNEILGSVFEGLDPSAAYATVAEFRNVLRDNLNKAVRELDGAAIGDPLTVATMQSKLGVSLVALGEPNDAIAVLKRSADTRKARLGPDHPETLKSMNDLAVAYEKAGKLDLAVPLSEETLKLQKAKLGPDHPDMLSTMNNLAVAYKSAGKLDLAVPLSEETLELYKAKLGPDHPDTLVSMNNLAVAYNNAGKRDLAVLLHEQALKLYRAKLGPDHPETLRSMLNLATAYRDAGKLDLALPLFEETLKLYKAKLGSDHPDTLMSMNNLAVACLSAGKADRAVPLLDETLKFNKAKLGPDHPDTLRCMGNLAAAYTTLGKMDLALPLAEETFKLHKAKLGPDHPGTLFCMHNLAAAYEKAGKMDLALPHYEETLKLRKVKLGPDNPETLRTMASFGSALLASKDFTKAESLLRECLAIREKTQPDNWQTFDTQSRLGGALFGQKKYNEAEPLLLKGYAEMKQREKSITAPSVVRIPEALDRLISLYKATNKRDEVKKWQAERAKYPYAKPAVKK